MAITNSSSSSSRRPRSADVLEPVASRSNKHHHNPFLKAIRGFCNPHYKDDIDFDDDDDDLNDGYDEQQYTVTERSTVIASLTMPTTSSSSSLLKEKSTGDTDSLPALMEEDDQFPVPSSDGSGHEWVNDLIIENETAAVVEPTKEKKLAVDKTPQRWYCAAIALALLLVLWKMTGIPVAVEAPLLQQVFTDNAVFNSSLSVYEKLLAPLSHGTVPNFNTDLVLTEEPVELEVDQTVELITHKQEQDSTEMLDFADGKGVSSDTKEGVAEHNNQGEMEVAEAGSKHLGDEEFGDTRSFLDYVIKRSNPVQDSNETLKDEALNDINHLDDSDEQSDPMEPPEEKSDSSTSSKYLLYSVAFTAVFAALDWAGVADKKVSSSVGRKEQRKMKKKERRRSKRVEA